MYTGPDVYYSLVGASLGVPACNSITLSSAFSSSTFADVFLPRLDSLGFVLPAHILHSCVPTPRRHFDLHPHWFLSDAFGSSPWPVRLLFMFGYIDVQGVKTVLTDWRERKWSYGMGSVGTKAKWEFENHFYNSLACNGGNGTRATDTVWRLAWY